jgi:hypothetical protein
MIALLVLLACGDDARAPIDAGVAADAATPEEIASPMPPALGPCAAGWTMDGAICVPPEAPPTCPAGTAAFVDQAGCTVVGDACPGGDAFPPVPDGFAHRIYVRPGATGTGTEASPLGSISAAMRMARANTALALAPGTYEEALDVIAGVTVIGACAERTRIAPRAGSIAASLDELGVALENVTVAAPGEIGVSVLGRARIDGVVIEGGSISALWVQAGATLEGANVVVRDATGEGRPIAAEDRSTVTLSRVVFEDNAGGNVVTDGATFTLDRVRARRNGRGDVGLFHLQDGVMGRVSALAVEDNAGPVLVAFVSSFVLEDAAIARSKGLALRETSRLELRRASFADATEFAVSSIEGSTSTVEDLLVRGVTPGASATGVGLLSGSETTLVARRVALEGCSGAAFAAAGYRPPPMPAGPGATIEVEDLAIARTGGGSGENSALVLHHGTTGTLARVRLEDNSSASIVVSNAGTDVAFTDLVVAGTTSREDGTFGRGVEVQEQAHATIVRARIERSHEVSVMAVARARLELEDVSIVESQERPCVSSTCADAPGGTGLGVYGESVVSARGVDVERARLCGVQVATDASLDLRGGSIALATIGACVQVDGYDIARLTDGVAFRENGTNVDSASHALPEPGISPFAF